MAPVTLPGVPTGVATPGLESTTPPPSHTQPPTNVSSESSTPRTTAHANISSSLTEILDNIPEMHDYVDSTEESKAYADANPGRTKSVLRAVLTRWTSHYLAFVRLLELLDYLRIVIAQDRARPPDRRQVIAGDRSAREKATQMVAIIEDSLFWHSLARVVNHLRPLAIATNVLQAQFCRLDTVLMTFGFLYMQFSEMISDDFEVNENVCGAVLASLEKRWSKADQELFIAAVIFNPYIGPNVFDAKNREIGLLLSLSSIQSLARRLYKRFWPESSAEECTRLSLDVSDYFYKRDQFQTLDDDCLTEQLAALKENREPNPLAIFNNLRIPGSSDSSPLIKLACHIFSVSTNSASCERLFSAFGNLLTKLRNRMGSGLMKNVAELGMHLRDQRKNLGSSTERVRRHFTNRNEAETIHPVPPPGIRVGAATSSIVFQDSELGAPPRATIDTATASTQSQPAEAPQAPRDAFRVLIEGHSTASDADDVPIPSSSESFPKVTLKRLFDFTKAAWAEKMKHSGNLGFEAEMELYDLVDLDAAGIEDDGEGASLGIDNSTEEIIASALHRN